MIIKEKYKTYLNHIILKPIDALPAVTIRLRPILFHIILKPSPSYQAEKSA